ncbi:MAG: cytochrome c [Candidatus Sericytochromatia bacterium]|nr:cytochrome c [Candidatus Sericytochromatia bacterium]
MKKRYQQWLAAGLVFSALAGFVQQAERAALAQAEGGADLKTMVAATPESIEAGKALFQAQCSSCHGTEGKGNGLAAAALNPKPRNFHVADAWINGTEFSGMYKTLEEGINGGKSGMNAYSHLPAKDRVALINYVRSLNSAIYPSVTDAELQKLDQDYDLSKALSEDKKNVPIPVKLAIEKLVQESAPQRKKVTQLAEKVAQSSDAGAVLFRLASHDLARSLTVLSHADPAWKGSLNDFVRLVSADLGQNGFATGVAGFSSAQWQGLHTYLKSMI